MIDLQLVIENNNSSEKRISSPVETTKGELIQKHGSFWAVFFVSTTFSVILFHF